MITSHDFGYLADKEKVTAYVLQSDSGFKATILSYGATLQSLIFPDGTDIALGFDNLDAYLGDHPYVGGIIGRVANRIGGASFEIEGQEYKLPENEKGNNLHSGPQGFDRVNWFGEIEQDTLILRHTSPDGHQGFPGEMLTEIRFKLEGSKLTIDIEAMVDKPCPINITYHPYFNLTDGGATPCTDHQLQIFSNYHTHYDAKNIPTGELSRTPQSVIYGYNKPRSVKADTALDMNYVIKLRGADEGKMSKMAKLSSDTTGHKIIVCSTEACLQAYTGAYIPKIAGKAGVIYDALRGIALEPQSYPDAVNQDKFPSNIVMPGEIYRHKISYTFRPGEALV